MAGKDQAGMGGAAGEKVKEVEGDGIGVVKGTLTLKPRSDKGRGVCRCKTFAAR